MKTAMEIKCWHKPETMGHILATHYADYPISSLPAFVVRILAKRWRARSDVFYVEARSDEGVCLGFIFGHSLGERPWRTLLKSPAWLAPFAIVPVLVQRLKRQKRLVQKQPTAPKALALDLADLPKGLLGSRPYLKLEYVMVLPQFRGMRVANHCFSALEEDARKAGLEMMSSRISVHNVASVNAHQRAGWDVYAHSPTELRTIKFLEAVAAP